MTLRAVVACVAVASVGLTAQAGELTHIVKKGESLESLAKTYYGSAWKAVYIATRNGLGSSENIVGKRLIVPGSWQYKIRRGDSLAVLAKRYLAATDRYKAVMMFNDITDVASVSAGASILMPFHLYHAVQPGEGPSHISRRYYRTTRYASMLMQYNNITGLKPGQKIVVPIFDRATVDARSRKPRPPPPVAKAEQETAPAQPPPSADVAMQHAIADAQRTLETAVSQYHLGEFDDACPDLDALLDDLVLEGSQQAELYRYLAYCSVALGDNAAAADYFREWVRLFPNAKLNPITTSPKILAVFHDATTSDMPDEAAE